MERQAGAATAGRRKDGGSHLHAAMDAVYGRYISAKPGGKLTKDGIRQVFEAPDWEHTSRADKGRLRTLKGNASNDVSEVYPPPRVTDVAEATGFRPGWAWDLTVNQDKGQPWDS